MSRSRAAWLAVMLMGSLILPTAGVLATPDPTSVTIAGSMQSVAGCGGTWDSACAATHLTHDATDDVWQGTFSLPAGSYQYKAALNDAWDENYGLHAEENGANIPFSLASAGNVKFYYDHKSHWVTDDRSSVIVTAAGSFQSELGCPGDWDPGCLRSWLQDPDGDGVYTFETTALPQGSYETKATIDEGFDLNYGVGGVQDGPNILFTVPVDNAKAIFRYDSTTHVLTVHASSPNGAPDGPGAESHFDLARKDCLGTARDTTSKVWFTVAGGVLSDVYYPTVDNTNLETLQYVVTDGSTFTDLQTRDMTYAVAAVPDSGGMACTVTASAKSGKYSIVTTYLTDPGRAAVLMRVELKQKPKPKPTDPSLRLYVRFDPTVNGNGGGGQGNGGPDTATIDGSTGHQVLVASDPVTDTNAANRDYAQPVFAALDGALSGGSSGFVGEGSDGLVQLDASHGLTATYVDAEGGNVVQVAQVGLDTGGRAELTLGFGATQVAAVSTAEGSLHGNFDTQLRDYRKGWQQYDKALNKPPEALHGLKKPAVDALADEYYLSANVLKASEDKTFPGAIVASLASPWGQAVSAGDPNNRYFGSYREVFARDLYEAWTGLLADGDLATARAATLFLSTSSNRQTDRCPGTASSTARRRPTRSGRSSTRRPIRS